MECDRTRYEVALRSLRRLEPYQPETYPWLEHFVLEACEQAQRYDKNKDPYELRRRMDMEAIDEVKDQLKAIARLKRFMHIYPQYAAWALARVHLSKNLNISSELEKPLNELWIEALNAYADALKNSLTAKRGPWLHRFQIGPLIYAKPVDHHSARIKVPTTGLLFQLVFYFRRFTHGIREFAHCGEGAPMPTYGEPFYDVAAEFVAAATGAELGTPSQVRHRLEKHIRENPDVGLGTWPGWLLGAE